MQVTLGGSEWNTHLRNLLPRETQTLLALAITSGDYHASYVMADLVAKTGNSKITVRAALAGLEAKGVIALEGQTIGCKATTTIRINPGFVGFIPSAPNDEQGQPRR